MIRMLLTLSVFLPLALACAGDERGGPAPLRFVTWKPNQPEVWDAAIERFERAHPEIRVERQVGPHSSTALHDLLTQKLKNRDPSVDVFFESLATHYRGHGVAVVLTGMGRDGAQGLLRLRDRGWATIAQDEATSVVYGMPKAAKQLGAAQHVLAVDAIASGIERAWSRLPSCAPADRSGGAR